MNTTKKLRSGLVFLIVFVDILCFSLLIPVLPYFAGTLGATPSQIGALSGLYALCQFIAAPIIGRLSDKFGRKPLLLLDIAGNAVGFVILSVASSLPMLFVARIIAGSVAANIPLAQAYISDLTEPHERSKALGLIGAAFGLGFTIGPGLGGFLSKNGYAVPALLSLGLCVINFFLVALLLPESIDAASKQAQPSPDEKHPVIDTELYKRLFSQPSTLVLLLFWAGFSVAFAMFQQNIALFNKFHLSLTARETGFVFVWIGILVSLMQGFFLRFLTKHFSDQDLLRFSAPVMVVALGAWAFSPSVWFLAAVLVPLCFAGSILITVCNSLISQSVERADIGGAMGIAGAIDNSTRFITAFLGGFLIQHIGTYSPGILAAVVMLGTFFTVKVAQKELSVS